MPNKTAQDYYNELSDDNKKHANAIANHYKSGMHPSEKAKLEAHAANEDHANMTNSVKDVAKNLGIPVLSTAGAAGLAWWLIKWLR